MTRIFLHGFTQTPAVWREIARPGDLCLPLPGHGRPGGVGGFNAACEAIAADIPKSSHVVGYSLGGRLALGIAVMKPRAVARLTIIGAHAGLEDAVERDRRTGQDSELASALRSRGIEWFVAHWESLPMWESQKSLPAAILAIQRRIRSSHRPEDLASALEQLGPGSMPSLWPALEGLEVPVDLVVGELDEKYRSVAERMAKRLPHARVEIVEGCGHNVALECPKQLQTIIDRCKE